MDDGMPLTYSLAQTNEASVQTSKPPKPFLMIFPVVAHLIVQVNSSPHTNCAQQKTKKRTTKEKEKDRD